MEIHLSSFFLLFLFIFPCNYAYGHQASLQTYIIHVRPSPDSSSLLTSEAQRERWYKSFLPVESRLIYSYHEAISGFAARLSEEELAEIEKKPGFLHAHPDRVIPLLTTHTPQFLGLDRYGPGLWKDSNFGEGVIVGVLDTGVWPDLPSFRDNGAIPPPSNKWKGGCEFGASVCNNKLIGARNFVRGINAMMRDELVSLRAPPYDDGGHGTHTASTAAGMFVNHANIDGQANGTAAGMAPYAHLSIYKVCSKRGCVASDILAGMDRAIADGVDVMSLSLGGPSTPYYSDSIAVGAFSAMVKGIFVSCAGGNAGPTSSSLSNEAPWILTVGASTMDRAIRSTVTLGNDKRFDGESIYQPSGYSSPSLPLIFPGSNSSSAAVCSSLAGINVKGKIVVCNAGQINGLNKGSIVKAAGGAGMIIANGKNEGYNTNVFMDAHVLPVSQVSYADGMAIKSYISSASAPTASIKFEGTLIGESVNAPMMAYFSSRGPNQADRNILKPDIIGPGVAILAAWPTKIGTPGTNFNMISGTSMATPHLSGIVAILKNMHPDWSPAAIKSAIMTTAHNTANDGKPILDQNRNPANFFATGAGHVDPVAASNPGLVYDLNPKDYIAYLCGMKYTDKQVSAVARTTINCSDYTPISGAQLNYPTFMVFVSVGDSVTVTRTVTNVGTASSTYSVNVKAPVGASVTVDPQTLTFSRVNEKAQYSVTFTGKGSGGGAQYSQGHLTWISSSGCMVKSPIMVAVTGGSVQSM